MPFKPGEQAEGSTPFQPGQPGGPGHPKGMKNRSTIARKWLELELQEINPITGKEERLSQEDIITLHQIKIAKGKSVEPSTTAYKALQDSAYGAPKQEIDQTNLITLTNFTVKDIVDFESDSEDTPEQEI